MFILHMMENPCSVAGATAKVALGGVGRGVGSCVRVVVVVDG